MTEPIPNQNGAIPISSRKMVRFAANVPAEVALQCTDGVRVEGRYGDRVRYSLTDDRTMYVDPFVAERIKELAIQPGELFLICKRQAKKGNRRTICWAVEQLEPETQLERDLRASIERAKAPEVAPQPAPAPSAESSSAEPILPVPPPAAFYERGPSGPDKTTLNGHNAPNGSQVGRAGTARPSTADTTPGSPPDTQLAHALKTAIAAAADAETFAKTLNYNIRFTTEDVRSMGITVLIGMQQRTQR
jgi:hypothetical protein